MQIERDFTSGNVTLSFENGNRIKLTREETCEFDERMRRIQQDELGKAAEKVARTGNRSDLQKYLKLRRNFL